MQTFKDTSRLDFQCLWLRSRGRRDMASNDGLAKTAARPNKSTRGDGMKSNEDHSFICCKECGQVRINTESGSVCPDGHGRIHARISSEALRMHHEFQQSKSLAKAKQVAGKPRTYRVGSDRFILASETTQTSQAAYLGNVVRLKPAAPIRSRGKG